MNPSAANGLVLLGPNHRVRPLDGLQWVLEARKQPRPGRLERAGGDWKPYAYCRTRAGLETALSRLRQDGITLDPAPLAAFSEFFPEPETNLAPNPSSSSLPLKPVQDAQDNTATAANDAVEVSQEAAGEPNGESAPHLAQDAEATALETKISELRIGVESSHVKTSFLPEEAAQDNTATGEFSPVEVSQEAAP